jgi:hypothetical protein
MCFSPKIEQPEVDDRPVASKVADTATSAQAPVKQDKAKVGRSQLTIDVNKQTQSGKGLNIPV